MLTLASQHQVINIDAYTCFSAPCCTSKRVVGIKFKMQLCTNINIPSNILEWSFILTETIYTSHNKIETKHYTCQVKETVFLDWIHKFEGEIIAYWHFKLGKNIWEVATLKNKIFTNT